MFSLLKDHPFAVEAFFEQSYVLSFAAPKEALQKLIPECLSLDTHDDKWAFIAVAMVQTKGLRPKGFPAFMGNGFFLIGYRIFVKYISKEGRRLRGLYILGSETDKKKMEFLGNVFTHYHYKKTNIQQTIKDDVVHIADDASGLSVNINTRDTNVSLPLYSPFADWKEARRFAGPLPFTFSYNPGKKNVLIVEGVREHWIPKPIEVISHIIPFVENLHIKGLILANAFVIKDIPYYWKKGRTESWTAR